MSGIRFASGILSAALGLALAVTASAPAPSCFADEARDAAAQIDQAERLIADGKASQARDVLMRVVKAYPGDAAAFKATDLLNRIKSIEVYIDLTHHNTDPVMLLPGLLRDNAYGCTISNAYLPTVEAELASHELVVIWQEWYDVSYDDAEYETLFKYARQGGHILFIADPVFWLRDHSGQGLDSYPVIRLARRFGLKTKTAFEELKVGLGKVFYYGNNAGVLTAAIAGPKRAQAIQVFERAMPYEKLEASGVVRVLDPEITYRCGRILLRYPKPLEKRARPIEKAVSATAESYTKLFGAGPAKDLTITGLASGREGFTQGSGLGLQLFMSDEAVLRQTCVELFQAWLQPEEKDVVFPYWLTYGFAQFACVEPLKKIGLAGVDDRYAWDLSLLNRAERHGAKIDINGVPPREDPAWDGKCITVYQTLVKTYGPEVLPNLRKMIQLYAKAGKLPDVVTTPDAVRLLSLAVGQDLVPYFRSIGTNLQPPPNTPAPEPLDLDEPEKIRKALEEKSPPVKIPDAKP